MAVTEEQARGIIQKEFPQGEAESPIEYRGLYIFMVNRHIDPEEDMYDPFYSVNIDTGEFRGFSMIDDGDPEEVRSLFLAKRRSRSRGGTT